MSYRISILDKSPLAAGETAAQALARTLTLAQHAEAWGYHRFWVAEHHNTDQLASPRRSWLSPGCWATPGGSVLGPAASCSSTIAPIRSRKTLTCWPPSRRAASIRVGKAPGGLPLSTRALQQGLHQEEKGTFADQLAQLDNWLSLTEPGERRAYAPRRSRRAGQMVFCSAPAWRVLNWPPALTGTLSLPPISMATARCAVPCSTAGASSAHVRRWSPSSGGC